MLRRLGVWAIIIAAVSGMPAASASVDIHIAGTMGKAQATGDATATGNLAGWMLEVHDGTAKPNAVFEAHGQRLIVETVTRDPVLDAGSGTPTVGIDPETVTEPYVDARMQGTTNRDGLRLNIFPLTGHEAPRLSLATRCAEIETTPSVDPWVPRIQTRNANRTIPIDSASAFALRDCSRTATWHISGDFVVTMWEWDATLTSSQGHVTLASGVTTSEVVPNAAKKFREIYVYVLAGTLDIGTPPAGLTALVNSQARFQVDGQLAIDDLNGHLQADGHEQKPRNIAVNGEVFGTVTRTASNLQAAFAGRASRLQADGTTQAWGTEVALGAGAWAWGLGLAGLAAGLVVLLVRQQYPAWYYDQVKAGGGAVGSAKPSNRREKRALGFLVLARNAYNRDEDRKAERLNRRGGRIARLADHDAFEAVILADQRRWSEAVPVLRRLVARLPVGRDRALARLDLAFALKELGDKAEATTQLRLVEKDDVEVFLEAVNDRVSNDLQDAGLELLRKGIRDAGRDPSFA